MYLPSGNAKHHGWWQAAGQFAAPLLRLDLAAYVMCGPELVMFRC